MTFSRRHFIAGFLAAGFTLKADPVGRALAPSLNGIDMLPPSGKPKHMVTLLHGFGGNGASMRWMAETWAKALPDTVFVMPNAPDHCHETRDLAAREWFATRARDPDDAARVAQIRAVEPRLNHFIDAKLDQYGLTDRNLAISGISQGAMMALHTAPRRARPCAAVVAYCGMLVDPQGLRQDRVVRMPIFAAHGTRDDIVAYDNLAEVRRDFGAAGFKVETASYNLGHTVNDSVLHRGVEFIRNSFAAPAPLIQLENAYGV